MMRWDSEEEGREQGARGVFHKKGGACGGKSQKVVSGMGELPPAI